MSRLSGYLLVRPVRLAVLATATVVRNRRAAFEVSSLAYLLRELAPALPERQPALAG